MKILTEASKLKSPANGNAGAVCIALIMMKRRKWEGERTRGTRKNRGKRKKRKSRGAGYANTFCFEGKKNFTLD